MPIGRSVLTGTPRLAAGQRDKLVLIQQRPAADAAGGSGFPGETWTTLAARVWMSRRTMRADEQFTADQLSASSESTWHLGYRADMDPDLYDVPKLRRLVYQGRTYDILSASLLDRRTGIEIVTLAGSAIR